MTTDRIRNDEMLAGEGDFVTVRAGFFVVCYPEDAQMPCLACG